MPLREWGTHILLQFPWRRPAPHPGTLRWAPFLRDEKWGKESLRAFPPKDLPGVRGWNCVKPTVGPSPLLWLLSLPPHQVTLGSWPYYQAVSTSGPTLEKRRSRRREPSPRQLGTVAYQGKALAVEGRRNREVNLNHRTASHLCDPTRLRAETRRTQGHPVPRGGFHKAGEGPAFGGSLVTFCPPRKSPQRSVPGRGAILMRRYRRRTGPLSWNKRT